MAQREKQRNSSTAVMLDNDRRKARPGIRFARKIYSTKFVVPAQAGTQTPQRFGFITKASFFYNNQRQGFWVPACAGTTLRLFDPAR